MPPKTITLFDLTPGNTILDRFTIKNSHRHGGMAASFEVTDALAEGDTRELQVYPAALFEQLGQSAEFSVAMGAWKDVDSEAVVALRDVVSLEDGTTLLITDFPPGRSLREWLKEHERMPVKRAVRVGLQLLEGLEAIHAADLVHGDVKPSTIHVTSDHDGHFVDGGITPVLWEVKHVGDKTQLIGTPVYAPVEQFGGDPPSVSSDIYSLATVMFELITGTVPWKGKSFLEVFQAKLDKGAPSMRAVKPDLGVPGDLDEVVGRAMMADHHERYATAAEFRERLAALELR